MRQWLSTIPVVLAIGSAGCLLEQPPERGEPIEKKAQAVETMEGTLEDHVLGFLQHVLGRGLNGTSLTGEPLDGVNVSHLILSSAVNGNGPLTSIALDKTVFTGQTSEGRYMNRHKFAGVTFRAVLEDDRELEVRIDSVGHMREPAIPGLLAYQVSYATEDGQKPLCGLDEAGEPIEALPLNGRWNHQEGVIGGGSWIDDPDAFTFACRGHIAAKCVEMGYLPWREAMECSTTTGCSRVGIGSLHQTCTRAMRADYCGDGTAHTVEGLIVNVYDGYGVRLDEDDWVKEAAWGPSGASCAAVPRLPSTPLPWCWSAIYSPACGDASSLGDGVELLTELPPAL